MGKEETLCPAKGQGAHHGEKQSGEITEERGLQ
jgi:hypothetical protein